MSSQYRQQQGFDNFQSADQLQEIISKLIKKELKNLKFCRMESAKILALYGNKADIGFNSGETVIQNVKVREGLNVSQGDEVYIMLLNGSASNLLIFEKKG
jgi:hypothetical protein